MAEAIKLDIISGFLGAGKTTLINKLLDEAYVGEKVALLENEFGEISIDGDILAGAELTVKEISNGCICCTLQGDFIEGIAELARGYDLDRIVIEPTGLSKLGDITKACNQAAKSVPVAINATIVVVSALAYPALIEVGGAFFTEQIADADTVLISAVQNLGPDDMGVDEISQSILGINPGAHIIAQPYEQLDGMALLAVAEQYTHAHEHALQEHHHEAHEQEHAPGHSHEHGAHDHHDHAHEMDGFSSISFRLAEEWPEGGLECFMAGIGKVGQVFRAKGFVPTDSGMKKVDYVYGHLSIEDSRYDGQGKLVIIGRQLQDDALTELFGLVARHG